MARGAGAAALLLAALVAAGASSRLTPQLAPPHPARGPAGALLGINEAISFPLRWLPELDPEARAAHFAEDARRARALGARWVRAHSATPPLLNQHDTPGGDWSMADAWVRAAQGEGLAILAMLSPWPGNRTAAFTPRYALEDVERWRGWVRAVVERYDGDGFEDMPGLRGGIRAWEVDNEPDLKNSAPPRGGPARDDFCTPEEYARVLVATAAAIREADPEALVLNGGFYRPMTKVGQDYARRVFAEPGVAAAVDVLSLHVYSSEPGLGRLREALGLAQELAPGKPVWITEIAVPSQGEQAHLSPDAQAEAVVLIHAEALARGVERVFWHTLADPPAAVADRGPGMRHGSLLQTLDDGQQVDKPAAVAYRELARALGDTPRAEIHEAEGLLWVGEKALLREGSLEALPPGMTRAWRARDGVALSPPLRAAEGAVWLSP